jgi:hypothetical protein
VPEIDDVAGALGVGRDARERDEDNRYEDFHKALPVSACTRVTQAAQI